VATESLKLVVEILALAGYYAIFIPIFSTTRRKS
jgi:hypothetical protein